MSPREIKNLAASIRQRLRNLANERVAAFIEPALSRARQLEDTS